ncbi:MAG: hypothetical protein JSV33_09395 [bacterium]|nr:MAG: hypothetical protein JSV33_09395 [bacterium]
MRPTVSTICIMVLCGLLACEKDPVSPTRDTPPEPYVVIEQPAVSTTRYASYAEVVIFRWRVPEGNQVDSVRYFGSQIVDTTGTYNPGFDMVNDLNENLWRYDDRWSQWMAVDALNNSGTFTVVGDDETLKIGRYHIFAVQARNPSGEVTRSFDEKTNIRVFLVTTFSGPYLEIYEPIIKHFRFLGRNLNAEQREFPGGVPLQLRWNADASYYGGEVTGYRYGWDIVNIAEWDAPFLPGLTSMPEVTFHYGTHMLTIEAQDQVGKITTGRIEITTVPFTMDRNLLWVDDFAAPTETVPDYSMPSERDHDDFWLGICQRTAGFDPLLDIYDCAEHNQNPPDLALLGRYKNIIWTYSRSSTAWQKIVHFVHENSIGQGTGRESNYISAFPQIGGHLWTLGRSDRDGGLAAVLDHTAQSFPLNLECEIAGPRSDCEGNRSGIYSMAYQDYCVTMLDKIKGIFRTDAGMPDRFGDQYDVLMYAYKDETDFMTAAFPGLPARLALWEEVTKPGMYFEPDTLDGPGGFTYAEIYDPEYWMMQNSVQSQPCFHSIYRMRAKEPESVLDNCTVAIWLTRYEDIVPNVSSGIALAAPSVHFGFPLWFFSRTAVDSISNVIFETWGIHK